jgi:hypothetical protein
VRRKKVDSNVVTAQAWIEYRFSVLKTDSEAECVPVIPMLWVMSLTVNTVAAPTIM